MARCPNCGRETARTKDWSCQWCGYPLLTGSYKKISKTYRELQEERMAQQPVVEAEPEPVVEEAEAEPVVEEAEAEPVVEEAETEPVVEEAETQVVEEEAEAEPVAEEAEPEPVVEAEPKPKARRKPAAKKKTAAKAKAVAESKPATRRKTAAKTEPVNEVEPEPVPEAEAEALPEAEPEAVFEAEPEIETEVEPEIATAAIEMTVEELLTAYEEEGASADTRFTNQVVRITGVVDRIEVKTTLDIYYISLTSAKQNRLLQSVRCVFHRQYGPELEKLTAGQTVTVQGKYDGSIIDISLRDCAIVG